MDMTSIRHILSLILDVGVQEGVDGGNRECKAEMPKQSNWLDRQFHDARAESVRKDG